MFAPLLAVLASLAWLAVLALQRGDTARAGGAPAAAEAVPGFPRRVPLAGGGELVIARPPVRIVPASARAIDLVAALVEPGRVAGFPEQAIEYATLAEREADYAAHPRFDVYAAEPVLRLEPDLVVADPWQSVDTRARLEAAGVPVLVLPDVTGWADVELALERLGRALGAEARARAVVADGQARVAALRAAAATRPSRRALCYSNFGAQGHTAGAGTTMDEMLRLAGLDNAANELGIRGHGAVTFEDLLRLDPDVLVVSRPLRGPAGPSGDRGGASEALLLSEPSLASLRAVRERRIVALDPGLFASASHDIVRGAEVLAAEVERLFPGDG